MRRDLLSGEIVVDVPRWTHGTGLPAIGQTTHRTGLARYTITDGGPLSAVCETRLSCDAAHFIFTARLTVTGNGAAVFTRSWDDCIARDHL